MYLLPTRQHVLTGRKHVLDIVNIVVDKERTQERFPLFVRLCISNMESSCMHMTKHLHQSDQWSLHRENIFLAFIPFMLRQGGIECQVTQTSYLTLLLITSLTWQFKEECIWFTRLDFLCAYVLSGEGPKKQALNLNAFFPNSFYFKYSTFRVVFWTVPRDFQNQNERKVATKHGFSKFNVKQILIGWGSFFYCGTENRKEQ